MIAPDAALVWLIAGLVLLVAEILVPGAFLMWLGLAALGTGVGVLLWEPRFGLQVLLFALLAALSIGTGLRLRSRRRLPVLNTAASGLVGRPARVLAFAGREGRVRVGDSDWPARLAPGAPAPEVDAVLSVVGVDGMMVIVGPGDTVV